MQEVGRGGRDGAKCIATLYYNACDVGTNVTNLKEEVKRFCTLTTCRRKFLTDHFGFAFEQNMPSHTCCDICELKCECDKCIIAFLNKIEDNVVMKSPEPSHKNYNATLLLEVLSSYFDAENNQLDIPNPEIFAGLSRSLLTDLNNSIEDITDEDCFKRKFGHLQSHFLSNIYEIIQNVMKSN